MRVGLVITVKQKSHMKRPIIRIIVTVSYLYICMYDARLALDLCSSRLRTPGEKNLKP